MIMAHPPEKLTDPRSEALISVILSVLDTSPDPMACWFSIADAIHTVIFPPSSDREEDF